MSNKRRIVYLSSLLMFTVLIYLINTYMFQLLYSEELSYFFSPFSEQKTDYYITVFFDVVATGTVLLFAKFVLRKLHNNRSSGIGASVCTDIFITHLAVCLFTLITFWTKVEWQFYSALKFIFSGLFLIGLLICHKNRLLKAIVVAKKRTFQEPRLLLYGVLIVLPLVVVVFQIYTLLFSLDNYDYVYVTASPVSMYFLPIRLLFKDIVVYIFNPNFLDALKWDALCTDILPYSLLAVFVDCSTVKFMGKR